MKTMTPLSLAACCVAGLLVFPADAGSQQSLTTQKNPPAAAVEPYDASVPKPTLSNVSYGPHERHVLDFWKAPTDKPAPLVFVIHGGGWQSGSKERIHRYVNAAAFLKAGISIVAINYRLIEHAKDVEPPVKAPMLDAARALQFVRSKAREWNIDKTRIGATGGSAGGCSGLWLAYHDDLADPKSADPVARESTRLQAVAADGPQTTLDPKQMREWTPNSTYGGHAFGMPNFNEFFERRESILPWIAEYSPYEHVSKDDPPVFMVFPGPPAIGKDQADPTHSANFGVKLKERCVELGLECEVVYPGSVGASHRTPTEFLIATLGARSGKPGK